MSNFIDKSLARGLARSVVRETEAADIENNRRVLAARNRLSPPSTPAAFYRRAVKIYRDRSSVGLIGEHQFGSGRGKKHDQHMIVMLDAIEDQSRMGLGIMWLRAETSTAVDFTPLIFSAHACERIFQRLGTMERKAVKAELSSCSMLALRLWAGMRRPEIWDALEPSAGVILPTKSGGLIVHRDDKMVFKPHLLAATWIDADLVRPDQQASMDILANDAVIVRSDGERIILPIDLWSEAQVLLSMYGREQSIRV